MPRTIILGRITRNGWKVLLCIIACFGLFDCTFGVHSKILVLSWPNGRSHFTVMEKIGQELESRGHEVVFLINSMENYIDKVKVTKEVYQVPGYPVDFIMNKAKSAVAKKGYIPFVVRLSIWKALTDSCEAIFADKELISRVKDADLLLTDAAFGCGSLLAEYLSIPRVDVGLWSFADPSLSSLYNIPNPVSYNPQQGTGYSPQMTFLQRVQNMMAFVMTKGIFDIVRLLFVFSPITAKYQIGHGKTVAQMVGEAELFLVPVDFALEWARPLLPSTKVIGAVLPQYTPGTLPVELETFMQSSNEHGVVLVSFGTMFDNLGHKAIELLAAAFGRLKQKVIWRLTVATPRNLGENTMLMKWLPQFELLGHPKTRVFFTHCGMNGMYEGAFHGVPMLGLPLLADQPDNAQKIVSAGMGIRLSKDTLLEDDIVKAVEQLIADQRYKSNALRVSRLMKDRPRLPVQEGADWVEYVLRHNGTSHLRPEVFKLNSFQYYLVDVVGFLAACLTVFLFICVKVCTFFVVLFCGKKDSKEKEQ